MKLIEKLPNDWFIQINDNNKEDLVAKFGKVVHSAVNTYGSEACVTHQGMYSPRKYHSAKGVAEITTEDFNYHILGKLPEKWAVRRSPEGYIVTSFAQEQMPIISEGKGGYLHCHGAEGKVRYWGAIKAHDYIEIPFSIFEKEFINNKMKSISTRHVMLQIIQATSCSEIKSAADAYLKANYNKDEYEIFELHDNDVSRLQKAAGKDAGTVRDILGIEVEQRVDIDKALTGLKQLLEGIGVKTNFCGVSIDGTFWVDSSKYNTYLADNTIIIQPK